MRSRQSTRRSFTRTAFLVVFMFLVVGGGFFGVLWAAGYLEFAPETHEGQIAFPASAQPIPAYTKITQEHLINPQTQKLHIRWVEAATAQPYMIRDLSQIMGRVAAHDISPNKILTESNLLPKGTRPGLTAGVPPGKRSMTLDVSKVPGLESLRRGDRFDLLTALPMRKEGKRDSNVKYGALLGGLKPPDTRAGRLQRQTGVKVLVRSGVMVAHTKGQEQSTEGGNALVVPDARNRQTNQLAITATIAVDPAEVMPLIAALGLDVKIYCVAHSGHPDSADADSFPDLNLKGLVPVPATVRAVKAFSRITQADLADPITGKLNVYYFSPERIDPAWVVEFREMVGRVVSRDVEAGYIFSQSDLMPLGTPPGLAAAVPQGKVALAVLKDRLQGLEDLRQGDRFDVLSTLPEGIKPPRPSLDWATLMGGKPRPEDAEIYEQLRTGLRILTRDAVKLMNDAEGEKTAIAVNPEAVMPLSQMLGREEIQLQVVAHPGRRPEMVRNNSRPPQAGGVGFGSRREDEAPPPEFFVQAPAKAGPAAEVEYPVTTQPIKAFTRLTIEDFQDPGTGKIRYLRFSKENTKEDWETDITRLIDRVAARDILPGRVVQSGDLLPPGTRPGVVAGIPSGMVAFTISSLQVDGLAELKAGDEFLIVAARPFRVEDFGVEVRWALKGGTAQDQTAGVGSLFQQAQVTMVLRKAVLISASTPKIKTVRDHSSNVESQRQSMLQPSGIVTTEVVKTEPVPESYEVSAQDFVIAVAAGDVASLSEAVETKAPLHAVLRSSHPMEDRGTPDITESRPLTQAHFIEHIRGKEKSRELWLRSR